MGCDQKSSVLNTPFVKFQSTHPSWGATFSSKFSMMLYQFQSTHPSWGATFFFDYTDPNEFNFNPRTHRGVRHLGFSNYADFRNISIHAPIVGCDKIGFRSQKNTRYFNPRTHRGVRHIDTYEAVIENQFQSTHPSWGATS